MVSHRHLQHFRHIVACNLLLLVDMQAAVVSILRGVSLSPDCFRRDHRYKCLQCHGYQRICSHVTTGRGDGVAFKVNDIVMKENSESFEMWLGTIKACSEALLGYGWRSQRTFGIAFTHGPVGRALLEIISDLIILFCIRFLAQLCCGGCDRGTRA